MKKYIVEFIGTFFLVLTVGCCAIEPGGAGMMAPLAIGASLMVMIFAGAHISGGHYNPAVTLAVCVRGKCPVSEVPGYWISQAAGGVAAAFVALFLRDHPAITAMHPDVNRALLAEFLYTFALCYIVLNVATAKGTAGNGFYGLAIGFTVVVGAYSVGAISGGAFNPAVATGITVMGLSTAAHIWIYFVSEFSAAIVAAILFRMLNPQDK
jgi:aquaporin Z